MTLLSGFPARRSPAGVRERHFLAKRVDALSWFHDLAASSNTTASRSRQHGAFAMSPEIAIGIAGLLVAAVMIFMGSNAGKHEAEQQRLREAARPERERELLRALDALEGTELSPEAREAMTRRLLEIVGCYLPYLWLREGRTPWLLVPAAASLALFAWLLTLHPQPAGPRLRGVRRHLHRGCAGLVVARGRDQARGHGLAGSRALRARDVGDHVRGATGLTRRHRRARGTVRSGLPWDRHAQPAGTATHAAATRRPPPARVEAALHRTACLYAYFGALAKSPAV